MDITPEMLHTLRRPAPYEAGESLWTHPHIAAEMLKAHLDPTTDAASYAPDTIDRICTHLEGVMRLGDGSRAVDLGCGPGLYCHRLATLGVDVTGIDQSENSLRYARDLCNGQNASFVQSSYLDPFGEDAFDAALLISQDYGVLPPAGRASLLANVHRALHGGGLFALDVPTTAAYEARAHEPATAWEAADAGFWRPYPYLTLHAIHLYPELPALCDLYAVLDGDIAAYRVWQTYYTEDALRLELTAAGFAIEAVWGDLTGLALRDGARTMAMLARKL